VEKLLRVVYILDQGVTIYYWWLRSPGLYDDRAARVGGAGDVFSSGEIVDEVYGVRPAFHLDLNSVLFTSAAAGSRPDGQFQPIDAYDGNEWKLTLKDSSRDRFAVGYVQRAGNDVTIYYGGAKEGPKDYVSAIIMDREGNYTHYGRLGKASSGTGASLTFTLPELAEGSKLYIFSEQYNGDYKTDYASNLVELAIPAEDGQGSADGREVELRNNGTHIQWRYAGEDDSAWRDLVALDAITGGSGKLPDPGICVPGRCGRFFCRDAWHAAIPA